MRPWRGIHHAAEDSKKSIMMTAASATKKSSRNSYDDVFVLAENLAESFLSSKNDLLHMILPQNLLHQPGRGQGWCPLQVPHPSPSAVSHTLQVIDAGNKLSILLGFSRVLNTENAHMKLLSTEGIRYAPNLAWVAVCSSQVTLFVKSITMIPLLISSKETFRFVSCPSSALSEMCVFTTSTGSTGQLAWLLFLKSWAHAAPQIMLVK